MKTGKLTNEQLQEIFKLFTVRRPEVLMRPGIGGDCAALRFGETACVLTTDPITGAGATLGELAVHINANDIAASGSSPVAMLVTLLAPPTAEYKQIYNVTESLSKKAEELNIEIIGGHTEVTDAVNRIVVSVAMIGQALADRLVKHDGARAGDALIMTKYAGIEGTVILASDFSHILDLSEDELNNAKALSGMLSVLTEGMIAAESSAHAMHDITEGGVLAAAAEMAQASGLGVNINYSAVPVLPITLRICKKLDLDPLRLISSGSLLIAAADGELMLKALHKAGIDAAVIGIFDNSGRAVLRRDNLSQEEISGNTDELMRFLAQNASSGA